MPSKQPNTPFLAEASRRLADSLDYETTLATVASLSLPHLGAWCIVDVCVGDTMRRLAVIHPDPEMQALARRLESGWPPERDDPFGVPHAVRTRRSEIIPRVTDEMLVRVAHSEEILRILRALGMGSLMTVPLLARGDVLGAITYVSPQGAPGHSEHDLLLAEDLAARCAIALDNARLFRAAEGRMEAQAAQKAAEASEERLRLLAESARDYAMFLLDLERRITSWSVSAERIFGYRESEVLGQSGDIIFTAEDRAAGAPEQEQATADATGCAEDRRWHRRKDGSQFWADGVLTALRDEAGGLRGYGKVLRDATEQRRADEERDGLLLATEASRAEAEAANRSKSDFLAAMSHELRTPLNAIGGYVDLIGLGIHGPTTEAQREALGRIRVNYRHLLTLINDILAYAKLEAGHVEFNLRPVAAPELLASVEPLVGSLAQAKGIAYSVQECDAGLRVLGDAERVRQILLNLVGNAVKFTESGGWVVVSCNADADTVKVRVRDNGPGIEPEQLHAIFDPFIQVDRRLDRPQEGIGLGLAISRDLARGMGGELTVESTLGEGTTFALHLPRAGEQADATPPAGTARPA